MNNGLLPSECLHEKWSNTSTKHRTDWHHSNQETLEGVLGNTEVQHLNEKIVTLWLRDGSKVEK